MSDDLKDISDALPDECAQILREGRTTKNKATHEDYTGQEGNFNGARGNATGGTRQNRPVYQTMAHMAAVGYTHEEIAERTGYSRGRVSHIMREPTIQPMIERVLEKTVQEEMKTFLEQEVLPTLHVLKTVRDNPQARPADRISAGRELLDRYLGKAVQPMSTDAKPVAEQTDEELRGQVAEALSRMNQPN